MDMPADQEGFSEVLHAFLQGLSQRIDGDSQRALDRLPADDPLRVQVGRAIEAIQHHNLDAFFQVWEYPHQKMTRAILQTVLPGHYSARFLLTEYKYVETNFRSVIQNREGMMCCADKSRTILSRLLRYFISGEEITFNMEDPYTFSYPTKVFTTHDSVVSFFEKLQSIHHGSFDLMAL